MNAASYSEVIAMRSPKNAYAAEAGLDACGAANFALGVDKFSAAGFVEERNRVGVNAQTIGAVGVKTDAVRLSG